MALQHLQSAALINADATPTLRSTAGQGAAGELVVVDAVITPAASADIHSTFEFFRVRSNAKVKRLTIQSETQGSTGTLDVGAFYGPDGPAGDTVSPPTYNGVSLIDLDYFLQALDISGQSAFAQVVPGGGFSITGSTAALLAGGGGWTAALGVNTELWVALGLTSDPRCSISIIGHAAEAFGTGAAPIRATLEYVK